MVDDEEDEASLGENIFGSERQHNKPQAINSSQTLTAKANMKRN